MTSTFHRNNTKHTLGLRSWTPRNKPTTQGRSWPVTDVPLQGMGASQPGTQGHLQEGRPTEINQAYLIFTIKTRSFEKELHK
jgi:hypothetical protein